MFHRLRIHLRYEGGKYAALLGTLALICLIIYFGLRHQNRLVASARAAREWPSVEATVVSSRIAETNTSGKTSFSTRLHATVRFSYLAHGEVKYADYAQDWGRSDYRNWSELLGPGRRIAIRVSPDDPKKVSLIDYNGIP